jgi:hypothetical protein
MPKPKKELNSSDQLLLWLLNHKSAQHIESPREWIKASEMSQKVSDWAGKKANGDLISEKADTPSRGKSEAEKLSEIQSMVAQIKANKSLQKRHWAIAYYYYQQSTGKSTKEEIAEKIRTLLVADYPDEQIPTAKTIATRWLREEVKGN